MKRFEQTQKLRPGFLERWMLLVWTILLQVVLLLVLALIPWKTSSNATGRIRKTVTVQLSSSEVLQVPQETLGTEKAEDNFIGSDLTSPSSPIFQSSGPSLASHQNTDDISVGMGVAFGGGARRFSRDWRKRVSRQQASLKGIGFPSRVEELRRHGLDLVILFDSSGSMQGEIQAVKKNIHHIGETLNRLIPDEVRFSICTYRDEGDDYVNKGIALTKDIGRIAGYLSHIHAAGGGDRPEAVEQGLAWAIQKNDFREDARKIILLIGDSPPREHHVLLCERLALGFWTKHRGVISTITCRSEKVLPAFESIAKVGGGEAFLTSDRNEIMQQLMALVFGADYPVGLFDFR